METSQAGQRGSWQLNTGILANRACTVLTQSRSQQFNSKGNRKWGNFNCRNIVFQNVSTFARSLAGDHASLFGFRTSVFRPRDTVQDFSHNFSISSCIPSTPRIVRTSSRATVRYRVVERYQGSTYATTLISTMLQRVPEWAFKLPTG